MIRNARLHSSGRWNSR